MDSARHGRSHFRKGQIHALRLRWKRLRGKLPGAKWQSKRTLPGGRCADQTPGDGELYVPVPSIANVYDDELPLARSVNFKDYALIADRWLDQQFWPAP
ncbi:MAG: hypothetical protein ACYTAO_22310 [Planctomycetota bacterium]|jgi:hypothetical protein